MKSMLKSILELTWNNLKIDLWLILNPFGDHFGIHLGFVWGQFWGPFGVHIEIWDGFELQTPLGPDF